MSSGEHVPVESLIHHLVIQGLLDTGRAPTLTELEDRSKLSPTELERALRSLEATHGIVLHPHSCEPWIVHPFSTSPSHTWVATRTRGWWAPCVWCALGISALSDTDTVIHTRIGAEADPLQIRTRSGVPHDSSLWVHFPEPPRVAWRNVHHFCARLVAFHQPEDAAPWAERHGFPLGQMLPIAQLGDLAQRWYGRHADRHWAKWTITQAREIFTASGLTGPFWELPDAKGKF